MSEERRLRPSAKAVVIVDGKVLVTRNRTPGDPKPDWYIFPGGGQHPGETLPDTLVREVREETGIEITPGPLLWVRELNVVPHIDWPFDPRDHCIEFMFRAEFVAAHDDAHEEDQFQRAVEWLSPQELADERFYPNTVLPSLASLVAGGAPAFEYLGDVD